MADNTQYTFLPLRLLDVEELRRHSGWFIVLGIALVILGVIALGDSLLVTVVSVTLFGLILIVGAVIGIIEAFRLKKWSGFFLYLFLAILSGIVGLIVVANPVSDVWNIVFQDNNFILNGFPSDKTRYQNILNFQPVLPIHLTKDLNIIFRPVLPFVLTSPVFDPGEGFSQKSGFGDMAFVPFLSPAHSGHWLIGVGPSFIFPTASNTGLGQGKWQLRPVGVIGYLTKKWIASVFPQQWWSYAGDDSRPSTSQANIQYFAFVFLANAWQVGTAPNVLINWKADNDNKVTFPVGLQVGKTVRLGKLPVNFQIQGQWMPWHPDDFSQRWNIQLVIKPVIPSLISGTIFLRSV